MIVANADALETAVREHARLVYRICFAALRNHHDAEDATQEVFMRVLRYRRKLTDVEDVRTWLAQIAWRVAVEQSRKSKAHVWETLDENTISPPALESGAANALLTSERMRAVERIVATLPPKLRDPLRLLTLEEMTPADVAAVLGINEAAVRSRVFRARKILREKLTVLMGEEHGA